MFSILINLLILAYIFAFLNVKFEDWKGYNLEGKLVVDQRANGCRDDIIQGR